MAWEQSQQDRPGPCLAGRGRDGIPWVGSPCVGRRGSSPGLERGPESQAVTPVPARGCTAATLRWVVGSKSGSAPASLGHIRPRKAFLRARVGMCTEQLLSRRAGHLTPPSSHSRTAGATGRNQFTPPLPSGRGLRPQTITSPSAPFCPGCSACRKFSFCLWATATWSRHLVQLEEEGERWIGAVRPGLPAGGVSHTHVDSITPSLGQRGDQLDPYR